MIHLRRYHLLLMTLSIGIATGSAQSAQPPQAEISNGPLHASIYLPDAHSGYYRGTRFDWAGVIHSLTHDGHNYYGPWFTKTDPHVIDFIFQGDDIIAGPASAITGPVEEFSTHDKALGFDQAKPGGTFIKIGVGVLRRPDDHEYSPYRPYEIVDGGGRSVSPHDDSVEFSQTLSDPATGYAYRYTKTLRLVPGKPELVMEHKLENTGKRAIETSVYNHNFFVPDGAGVGPEDHVLFPFEVQLKEKPPLAVVHGRDFTYEKALTGRETVAVEFVGFKKVPESYHFRVENRKVGAGFLVTSDRPLTRLHLWSIRSVVAVEPYLDFNIAPGQAASWHYTYTYFSTAR
jgi:hypothetical protein